MVEILVALCAGVLVSMAAFGLSKNATTFFQHEARISSAQLSLTLGLNRIAADLQRASFLSTPNAFADPLVCRHSSWSGLPGLQQLAGINIQNSALPNSGQSGTNGYTPEQLIVGGSLDATEVFTVQCVINGVGNVPALQLQDPKFDGAMARVLTSLGPGETMATRLGSIFQPGRFVQLLDPATGYKVYGVIGTGTPVQMAGNIATVQLQSPPTIPFRQTSACGIIAPPSCGSGLLVSVVTRVLYDIRSLASNATYGALVAPQVAAMTGDGGRTELIRVPLKADGSEDTASLQLVSEYAIDMRFGITVTSQVIGDDYHPTVKTYELGDGTATTTMHGITGDVWNSTATPQRIRAVQVRLSTRTRAPDRSSDLPHGADGRRLRFSINPGVTPGFARIRTGYVNVSLLNQGGFALW